MPLVTLTTRSDADPRICDGVLAAVHSALVAIGVPEADRFQRVLRLQPQDFCFDATYPDLKQSRSEKFVLIEVTLSVGRTMKLKRKFAETVVASVQGLGLSGENVMIVFNETRWENWSFGGARFFYT
jgi:phenylpyruvate tautomerase PptA (4-oxalocrotonate tautomerase family)